VRYALTKKIHQQTGNDPVRSKLPNGRFLEWGIPEPGQAATLNASGMGQSWNGATAEGWFNVYGFEAANRNVSVRN